MNSVLTQIVPLAPPAWLSPDSCSLCGGRLSDVEPAWTRDDARGLAVFEADDPSCSSAGLGASIWLTLQRNAFVEAHRGCALSCPSCSETVPLVSELSGLVRSVDAVRFGRVDCPACSHRCTIPAASDFLVADLSVVRLEGMTWCGSGHGCVGSACPLNR